jgi:hypothetical protein
MTTNREPVFLMFLTYLTVLMVFFHLFFMVKRFNDPVSFDSAQDKSFGFAPFGTSGQAGQVAHHKWFGFAHHKLKLWCFWRKSPRSSLVGDDARPMDFASLNIEARVSGIEAQCKPPLPSPTIVFRCAQSPHMGRGRVEFGRILTRWS